MFMVSIPYLHLRQQLFFPLDSSVINKVFPYELINNILNPNFIWKLQFHIWVATIQCL